MMRAVPDQRFAWICLVSVLLHALLFAALSWQRQVRPLQPLTLVATLRQMVIPHAGPVAETPPPAVPAKVPPQARPSSASPEHSLAPSVRTTAGPTMASAPAAPAAAADVAASGPAPVTAAAAPIAAPESAPQKPAQGELLAAYRQRLTALFASHQEYPRVAALRGWEGEVRLRLRVARKGNLLGVQLDHSSGFEVLDQHALAMLEQIASLPPLPEGLDANEILVVVPVNYKLKKAT